jgi:Tfp pilus assembly protein PilV
MSKRGSEAGFTLVEVLGAAIILAIALAAVMSVEVSALYSNRLSRNMANGSGVAADCLEAIHRYSPVTLAGTNNVCSTYNLCCAQTLENVTYTPTVATAPQGSSGTMFVISATVTWQDDASFLYGASTQHSVVMEVLRSTMASF